MVNRLEIFERIVRTAGKLTEARTNSSGGLHPFDERDIHPGFPSEVKRLFDNGHYSQSTFEAYKFIDKEIQRHSGLNKSGFQLMMDALSEGSPKVQLTRLQTISEKDEQKGYQFLFAGASLAIRNPRGHDNIVDTPDRCLDYLVFASLLLRRLEDSGYK